MILGVAKEKIAGEKRVAQTPETVALLTGLGYTVRVEKGAGVAAGYPDDEYAASGAKLVPTLDVSKVDVLAHVRPLSPATIAKLKKGAFTVG